jgi:eukaryotic-like serine/threonine-protein kinase
MPSARWQAIAKLFEAALEKPQGERRAFLRLACGGDSDLESEVVKLLDADQGLGSFLERPALDGFTSAGTGPRKSPLLSCGSVISGRFEILRFIGQGGMGEVYAAFDLELKDRVALKTIRSEISSDPAVLARFRREVQLTRRITHPNVCRTFDMERHSLPLGDSRPDEIVFLTMELLEGETLADLLRRRGRLATKDALPLVLQMVEALGAAHRGGVIHRDLKPSNILLVPTRGDERVVVTDFGLAHAVSTDSHKSVEDLATSFGAGTLAYMAPEQLERGESTKASDIYSLGLVMYEMVTGQRPFASSVPFSEALKRIGNSAPSPKLLCLELDDRWDATICKCLDRDPGARFESAEGVREFLLSDEVGSVRTRQVVKHRRRTSETVEAESRTRSFLRRNLVGIAGIVLLLALFVVALRLYQVRNDPKIAGGSTMLLTDIGNNTGDKRFDGTTELVRQQLSQSPYFDLMDSARVRNVLAQMGRPSESSLDPATAREVAMRSGAARVIFGGVSHIGDSYVLDVSIEQPDNAPERPRAQWENHWAWRARGEAGGKEIPSGFLGAVRDAGDWIRKEVGESANDITSVSVPSEDVTTGNWAALSEFSQAEKFKASGQPDSAVVALQNAVAEDPRFALAYMRLGDLLVSLNRYEEGYRAYRIALSEERRQRLTRRERYRLQGIFAHDSEDFPAAEAAFREYTVYYPNDYIGWFYRSYPLMMIGRPEEAIASLKKAVAIDANKMFAPAHIARFDLIVGRFDDASQWVEHLRSTGHREDANLVEGELNFLAGHYTEAESKFEDLKASNDALYRSYGFSLVARVSAELGEYRKAQEALSQGIAADLESGDVVHRADKLLDRAYLAGKAGEEEKCLEDTKLALELDRSLQRSLAAGTLVARAAAESRGTVRRRLLAELGEIEARLPNEELKPLSDIVRVRLRGESFLAAGETKLALEQFKRAAALEAPVKDKEYLGRGTCRAARDTTDPGLVEHRKECLAAYGVLTSRPGQIWQWALDYPPGYLSDQTFSLVKSASEMGMVDKSIRQALAEYLLRRQNADEGIPDIEEAKRLRARAEFQGPN